jgi:RsiW-degrading membrane proteinase PrsW (M82 family)
MVYVIVFIFGLLAAFAALLLELFFLSWTIDITNIKATAPAFTPTLFSLLILALIEETTKIVFFLRSTRFNSLSGHFLLVGSVFGIGFASLEYFALSQMSVALGGPFFGILLVHVLTSILLVALLRNAPTRNRILAALALITSIHFLYNALL